MTRSTNLRVIARPADSFLHTLAADLASLSTACFVTIDTRSQALLQGNGIVGVVPQ